MQSEQTNEISAALAKAQGGMKPVPFDRTNPHFKNKYTSLAAFLEAIRKPLADNGIAHTQATEIRDGALVLVTTLRHSSGQWFSSEWPLVIARPQEMGSALTYAKRYTLQSICGVAGDDDDDAEGARKDGQTTPQPPPRENPSVTRVEDATERRARYDTAGRRIDWIDTSMHRVKHLTGEKAKVLYKTLRQAMEMCQSVEDLEAWGVDHAEQVAQLGRSEEFFQLIEYQELLDNLREASAKEAA